MADKAAGFEPFVAVDVGSFSLKFVQVLPGEGGKPVLKALAHLPIPPFAHQLTPDEREKMSREDVEKDAQSKLHKFLTKHLTELLYDNQIQTKRAVTLASGRAVTIRYLELPPVPEPEALAAAVNAEAAKQMPFSLENAVMGFTELGKITKEEKALLQVMVAALQKDSVANTTDNLKGGGMSNEGILTLPQSLEFLMKDKITPPPGKTQIVALIHCGHKTTSIMIYKNGALNFYRDINMAGETITEAIFAGGEQDGAKIEFHKVEEAVELKHKLGVLPPDEIQALKGQEKFAAHAIFNTVEKIFQHIQLSISFFISQFGEAKVDRIYLSGGTAAMKNFMEFIQESLEVPAEIINPFLDIPADQINFAAERISSEAPALAAAVGVSLYAGQSNFINFIDILFPNRRTQSLNLSGVSSKFGEGLAQKLGLNLELDEKKLRIIAGLLGAFLLLIGSYPVLKIRQDVTNVKKDYKRLQDQLAQLTESQGEVTKLLEEKALLEKMGGFSEEIKKLAFPNSQLLLDLASLTPPQIFITQVAITTAETGRTFKLTGQTDSTDRVFEYIGTLGKSRFLKSPSLESSQETPIDDQRYFINFILSGKVEIPPPPEEPPPPEPEK